MNQTDAIIEIKGLKTYLGGRWVHNGLDLSVKKGEVLALVGGSGSGKTTVLRAVLGLLEPTAGSIRIFNEELTTASPETRLAIQKRWGVLFQQNALFSSLNLLKNVSFPLYEHTQVDPETIQELALLKIMMAGLSVEDAVKFPAELSGGMQKRGGLARAIVLDPEILFLDEPTAGLDPTTAAGFDDLILNLQSTMGLTIVMVTHDVDSLWKVANRVAFLGEGKVLCVDTMPKLVQHTHPDIQAFFQGARGRAAQMNYQSGR
ncbi:MAG TPA: ATP-binding cassette domain-containing protein [Gammaproteobacteria bacterium]|jgi:phospholipid/cholesterol/gamma-HCH transport system ATP-binding protein|nr:ATP-binding cassette domain-containing protein [Gammaproteobacteria bacterium]